MNAVASYRSTDYHHNIYQSDSPDMEVPEPEYSYGTVARRQAYIGELQYVNKFNRKFTLTAGARGSFSSTGSEYITASADDDHFYDGNLYAYTSLSGYFGKLYYLAGLGVSSRWTEQNGIRMSSVLPRPQLQFSYRLSQWRFNLRGVMSQQSPSLSEMADARFSINRYEAKQGNPDLKDWWKILLSLRVTRSFKHINVQNTLAFSREHHPVMESVSLGQRGDATVAVTSFANQTASALIRDNLSVQYDISPNLNLSAGVGYYHFMSRGDDFSNRLANWRYDITAEWYAGHWNIGAALQGSTNTLDGRTVRYIGLTNSLYVNYIIGTNWRFGLQAQNLFCKDGRVFREWFDSRFMHKEENLVVPAHGNMLVVSVAWNFSGGKKRMEVKQELNNSDNDSGVFK